MSTTAIFFADRKQDPDGPKPLLDLCRQDQIRTTVHAVPAEPEELALLLPAAPAIVFLPALEDDCLGVKFAQVVQTQPHPRVIILYGQSLPSSQYLCLAFREGVDDVISLDLEPQTLRVQLNRAKRLLTSRLGTPDAAGTLQNKLESLEHACRQLSKRNAKWEERILSLASATGRLATGELRLVDSPPPLLIVASAKTQGAKAAEVATQLGFDPIVAHTGQEALTRLTTRAPRVILTDGTLPDMDASRFAREARRVLGSQPVVIVAWSSSPEAEDALLGPDTGIDDFVLKSATSEGGGFLVAALLGGLR